MAKTFTESLLREVWRRFFKMCFTPCKAVQPIILGMELQKKKKEEKKKKEALSQWQGVKIFVHINHKAI